MVSKPLIYCCVPRAGIMMMTFFFGLSVCFPLIIFMGSTIFLLPDHHLKFHWRGYLQILARIVVGFAYFYTCYLVYKRKYKLIMTLLYAFIVDVLWDMYLIYTECYSMYNAPTDRKTTTFTEQMEAAGQKENVTVTEAHIEFAGRIDSMIPGIIRLLFVIYWILPLMNKIYVILKIRAYARYIEYKKDEAKLSSTSMEPPYRHPEIEKDD